MKTKHLKLIMELIFIFIIPLVILCINCNYQNTIEYDNNGNYQATEKHIEFNTPFIYYKIEELNRIDYIDLWFREEQRQAVVHFDLNAFEGLHYILINKNYKLFLGVHGFIDANDGNPAHTADLKAGYFIEDDYIRIGRLRDDDTVRSYYTDYYYGYKISEYDETYDLYKLESNDIENMEDGWHNSTMSGAAIVELLGDYNYTQHYIYTIWGNLKNLIVDNLQIQDNQIVDIIITYTILWFIMFVIWHFFYLFFDGLVHLFIDWKKRSD